MHKIIYIITGANGQLGKCLIKTLIRKKKYVFGLDISNDELNNIKSNYFQFYKLDITKEKKVQTQFKKIFKLMQADCEIHLINNAGTSVFSDFENRTDEEFYYVVDVNLKGTINCIKYFSNEIKNSQNNKSKSSIVNVSSIFGLVSPDFRNYIDLNRKNSEIYGASKAGIIQLTKYFSVYLSDLKIRVNCVSPGGIFNPQNPQGPKFIQKYNDKVPMKRMAKVEEIVKPILFLCSNESSYINGHNLVIDGGLTAW